MASARKGSADDRLYPADLDCYQLTAINSGLELGSHLHLDNSPAL
jgi:hypothetical protein